MEIIHLVFWLFAAVTCLSAMMVAFSPRLIHSVFALFFCFVGTAGLYVMLGADFLAATQVIIYIGGIMVLMIFGVMLTNRHGEGQLPNEFTNPISAILLAVGVVFLMWSFPRSWAHRDARWARNFDDVSVKQVASGSHGHAPGTVPGAPGDDVPAPASPAPSAAPVASPAPAASPAVAAAPVNHNQERVPAVSNTTGPIGEALLTQYLIPFELASLVLLLAMLGAASIARKEIR